MSELAKFLQYLSDQIALFISTKTAIVASTIEPAFVACGAIYVMGWGYLHLRGQINEPIVDGFKRIFTLAVIFGIAIQLWGYHELVTDTFFKAPDQLASAIAGAPGTLTAVDKIWYDANLVSEALSKKGTLLNNPILFDVASIAVYALMGGTALYTTFLLALSKAALAIVLALGPFFIALLLFDTTKKFFESWAAQLANYALITVLAVTTSALLLAIVGTYGKAAVAMGGAITIAETARLCAVSFVVLLVLTQVMSLAAGLSSGVGLATFGAFSGLVNWGLRTARRTTSDVGRGLVDGLRREPFGKYDSLTRGAGNLVGRGVRNTYDQFGNRTGGKLVPRERYYRSTTSRKP